MSRALLALVVGSAGLLASLETWAEQQLGPSLTRLGGSLGEMMLAPASGEANAPEVVDWEVIERGVTSTPSGLSEEQRPPSSGPVSEVTKKNVTKAETKSAASVFISAERVLRLSREASMPASRYVPAKGSRPAGLQVAGVTGLGIGARDGDVLTRVAGAEVRSSAAVVSSVLRLRAKKVKAISGELWRGQERILITFEMPYLEGTRPPLTGLPAKNRPTKGGLTESVPQPGSAPSSANPRASGPPTSSRGAAQSGS